MTSTFGEYRLLRLLGEGGMAQVWAARKEISGGSLECAVKIIKPEFADDPRHREMFVREGRLSLILSGHDNIVSTLDVGEHQGRSYLAMELIDGVTLTALARRMARPWPVAEAVGVVAGLLRALRHIHELGEAEGIVHRDVTPHNVMVSRRGEVKLMDFGIAQRADAEPSLTQALGKLCYVPREQVEGDPDPRADLYAVGAVLFELLDGRRFRWHCADEDALFQEIYRDRVPSLRRPDVPVPVLAVVRGLLQPHREQRIASATEALRGLEAWEGFELGTDRLERLLASTIDPLGAHRPTREPSPGVSPAPLPGRPADQPPGQPPAQWVGPPSATPSGRLSPESVTREPSSPRPHAVSNVPCTRPWDEVRPTAEHPRSHPWLMVADERPPSRVSTEPHPRAVVAVADTDEIAVAKGTPVGRPRLASGGSAPRPRGLQPFSQPAWAGQADIPNADHTQQGREERTCDVVTTRAVPASQPGVRLGADPMERRLTRRRPAARRERDSPMARNSAEIAVTEPQPSRRAPWAEGTKPIVPVDRYGIQPEPGAPTFLRRPPSDRSVHGSDPFEPLGSVSPRTRESAAMHEVATGPDRVTGCDMVTDADMVTGEIVIDDDLGEDFLPPPWLVGPSRIR